MIVLCCGSYCWAQSPAGGQSQQVREYRSKHFRVSTDVGPARARRLLDRLEATLRRCRAYWGAPVHGTIDGYVVDKLENWHPGNLPHPLASELLRRVGGAIDQRPDASSPATVRTQQDRERGIVIYAAATAGVAEHEAVHAYCALAFGRKGPDWYAEGMAQTLSQPQSGERGVACPAEVIDFLRNTHPMDLDKVVDGTPFTAPIADSLVRLSQQRRTGGRPTRAAAGRWNSADDHVLRTARRSYYWSWALCYMLVNNPNYSARFRTLGIQLLSGEQVSFQHSFAGVYDRLRFEYLMFLRNCDHGFRVDLCHWDWNQPPASTARNGWIPIRIDSARGYQATGMPVREGARYDFAAQGTWRTSRNTIGHTARGDVRGHGRLVGIVMRDLRVSERFDLGTEGSFSAPLSGQLYLRCLDAWHELADNEGTVQVQLRRSGE